jgi:hypothetical protein
VLTKYAFGPGRLKAEWIHPGKPFGLLTTGGSSKGLKEYSSTGIKPHGAGWLGDSELDNLQILIVV